MARAKSPAPKDSTANLGFEQKLRLAADKWKNNGDAVEPCGAKQPAKGCPQGERGGVHQLGNISIYGQDKWLRRQQPKQSNATTRRLAIMNLAIRGIEADFGPEHADTFRRDLHPDLRADYVLANPPFNDSDTALRGSAFLQSEAKMQVVSEAKNNMAGFVLANGSMSSNQSGDCPARSASLQPKAKPQSQPRQRDIRRALIEADLVDTALRDSALPQSEATPQVLSKAKNNMVALPGQLFYSTQKFSFN